MTMMKDAARLRKARQVGAFTQKVAAELLGLSTRQYQRLETGEIPVRSAYVAALEQAAKNRKS